MNITFLGHAGFLVETNDCLILIDAWCNPFGAFDGGWFQLPCNHHMIDEVLIKFHSSSKQKLVYVSHEHKDHFDPWTLEQLEKYSFTYILPKFRRTLLYDAIKKFTKNEIILCHDEETFQYGNTLIQLYVDDAELNRDSAIFIKDEKHNFLDINDCKIHDRFQTIYKTHGKINIFAAQFSGATWHPTCYDYTLEEYQNISSKKIRSKFESVARGIEILQCDVYIPSAGPACFLDPQLISMNFEPVNIFPREQVIETFLGKRLKHDYTKVNTMYPGDILDENLQLHSTFNKIQYQENFETYIQTYAKNMNDFFERRKKQNTYKESILEELSKVFQAKLEKFISHKKIERNLYIGVNEIENAWICIDFVQAKSSIVYSIPAENYYLLKASTIDFNRVLEGYMTWEDFSLAFRMRLNREPDIYQVLMQGFLILEVDDLEHFCNHISNLENSHERITIEAGGNKYSINRYCPHQGADLKYAWIEEERYLVCPRHRWRFDLNNEGNCERNSGCIHAIAFSE
jgi:UDP-MurNAc hydroxylase